MFLPRICSAPRRVTLCPPITITCFLLFIQPADSRPLPSRRQRRSPRHRMIVIVSRRADFVNSRCVNHRAEPMIWYQEIAPVNRQCTCEFRVVNNVSRDLSRFYRGFCSRPNDFAIFFRHGFFFHLSYLFFHKLIK